MNSRQRMCLSTIVLLAALGPLQSFAQPGATKRPHYRVKDVGTFGGPNSFFGSGQPILESVNNRGVVVGAADTGLPDPYAPNCFVDCYIDHAFRWKNGFLTDLGTLPAGYSSTAYSVNERGLIMGGSENGFIDPNSGLPEQEAVVWLQDGEIIDLGTLGGSFSFANDMNNRGHVVGFAENTVPDPYSFLFGTEAHAFVWRKGFMEDLGTLGGPDSFGSAVNEQDKVVGWAYINSTPNRDNGDTCAPNVPTQDPFLWEEGRMIDLGTFGGTCGVVGSFSGGSGKAINSRGQVIGTSNFAGNKAHHAFLWNEGALSDLGTLGGDNSEAFWINDAGEIVGRADMPGSKSHHAFLWKNGVMKDLGVPHGQTCSTAIEINAKSQIIIETAICSVSGGPGSLWDNGVLYDLNRLIPPESRFFISDPNFINDRGEIGVTGVLPNGDQHVLLLIPVDKDEGSADDGAAEIQLAPAPIDQPNRSIAPSGARRASRYGRLDPTTSPLP